MATNKITDSTFNDILKTDSNLIVVDFWAEWCGPCKMLGPVLEEISDTLQDSVSIYKLNTDENIASSQEYQISSIPCCIVFKEGKEVHRIIGHKPKDAFIKELEPFMS
jgi:thioredoxin 1